MQSNAREGGDDKPAVLVAGNEYKETRNRAEGRAEVSPCLVDLGWDTRWVTESEAVRPAARAVLRGSVRETATGAVCGWLAHCIWRVGSNSRLATPGSSTLEGSEREQEQEQELGFDSLSSVH